MSKDFHIRSLCVVKNEADVVVECLRQASQWSDRVYVLDNGSTDGTWDAVLACANERIVPWKQDGCQFRESLRSDLYNAFRGEANPGDWWCRLDADEFYVDNPREFLAGVGSLEHVVWGVAIEYYLTNRDVDSIDFHSPISQVLSKLRYYSVRNSEPRFVRHRARLNWGPEDAWPRHMGLVHPRRIRYRHYKYRSPEQIQTRLATRRRVIEQGGDFWWKHQATEWTEAVVSANNLCYDDGSGAFVIDDSVLPRHLESRTRRLAKSILHACGVWP